MNNYKVEVKEFLTREIEVTANSEEEAIEKIKELYQKEQIVLDWNDYLSTEFDIKEKQID